MVRLEYLNKYADATSFEKFQFLNGAIRIDFLKNIPYPNVKFQFLNGAIRIKRTLTVKEKRISFNF